MFTRQTGKAVLFLGNLSDFMQMQKCPCVYMCVYVCVFLGLRVGKCCQQSSRLFANVWCVSAFFELCELFFFMFSDIKTLAEGSSVSLLSFHSTSSPYPPLSARPNLLKLPASSCCYEPRGFSAVL